MVKGNNDMNAKILIILVSILTGCKDKDITNVNKGNLDFSPNQNFLILQAVEKGMLLDGSSKEEIDKYNCMF
ncbi:hypothetical protein ACJRPK_04910 [Aquimarina sp. 2-A2]|uniref:hypothetical protein n=1 Tax=Aquimarina sp. 2-A2 TaxID=3382644 RepID=UPI00387F1F83